MTLLDIALIIFVVLETLNVALLYTMPGSTRDNAVGVFKAFGKTREDPAVAVFVDHLINWLAGSKPIFIVLIIGVLLAGSPEIKVYNGIALVFSIMTFYLRLCLALKRMDQERQLDSRDYSRTLAIMIGRVRDMSSRWARARTPSPCSPDWRWHCHQPTSRPSCAVRSARRQPLHHFGTGRFPDESLQYC